MKHALRTLDERAVWVHGQCEDGSATGEYIVKVGQVGGDWIECGSVWPVHGGLAWRIDDEEERFTFMENAVKEVVWRKLRVQLRRVTCNDPKHNDPEGCGNPQCWKHA